MDTPLLEKYIEIGREKEYRGEDPIVVISPEEHTNIMDELVKQNVGMNLYALDCLWNRPEFTYYGVKFLVRPSVLFSTILYYLELLSYLGLRETIDRTGSPWNSARGLYTPIKAYAMMNRE